MQQVKATEEQIIQIDQANNSNLLARHDISEKAVQTGLPTIIKAEDATPVYLHLYKSWLKPVVLCEPLMASLQSLLRHH